MDAQTSGSGGDDSRSATWLARDDGGWRPLTAASLGVAGVGSKHHDDVSTTTDPLGDDIRRIRLMLFALAEMTEVGDRQAVALELLRRFARLTDTVERAVEPVVVSSISSEARRRLHHERVELRRYAGFLERATRRRSARGRPADDVRVNRQLDELVVLAARHLAHLEDDVMGPFAALDPREHARRSGSVRFAARMAAEDPEPRRGLVSRWLAAGRGSVAEPAAPKVPVLGSAPGSGTLGGASGPVHAVGAGTVIVSGSDSGPGRLSGGTAGASSAPY